MAAEGEVDYYPFGEYREARAYAEQLQRTGWNVIGAEGTTSWLAYPPEGLTAPPKEIHAFQGAS